MWLKLSKSLFFIDISSWLVILCQSKEKKLMSKTQARSLSLKFAPYLFVAVTILTAFGSNNGTWVWMNLILMVWIKFGLIAF